MFERLTHAFRKFAVDNRVPVPHAPTFEAFYGLNGWSWHERASNGQISGGGGQGTQPYDSKYNALRAAYAHAYRVPGAIVRVRGLDDA